MALVASQNRQHDFDAMAVREAGNIMEDLMSRSWDELAPDNPPAVQMSPACADTLPDPELSIEIADDDTLSGVRRIVVQIRWGSVGKKPSHPVRLVAWRAQYQEEAHP